MKLITIKTEDFYSVLEYWWTKHGFMPVNIDMLPEEVFVVFKDNHPIYSMFVYKTNSKLCWIGWQLSNPDLSKEIKEGGLEFLIEEVTKIIKNLGYKFIFTTSPIKVVQDALIEKGYVLGDEKVNHYIKIL